MENHFWQTSMQMFKLGALQVFLRHDIEKNITIFFVSNKHSALPFKRSSPPTTEITAISVK